MVTLRGRVQQEVWGSIILKIGEIYFRFWETPNDQGNPKKFAMWFGFLPVFS
jgi:hypothetical protein